MFKNKRIAVIILLGSMLLTGIGSGIAAAAITSPNQVVTTASYCVKFGNGPGASGNVVEFNWDNSPCPPGTYQHELKVVDSDPFEVATFFLDSSSINPTANHSGVVFRIADQSTTPATIYDCSFTVPNPPSKTFTPGVDCVRAP